MSGTHSPWTHHLLKVDEILYQRVISLMDEGHVCKEMGFAHRSPNSFPFQQPRKGEGSITGRLGPVGPPHGPLPPQLTSWSDFLVPLRPPIIGHLMSACLNSASTLGTPSSSLCPPGHQRTGITQRVGRTHRGRNGWDGDREVDTGPLTFEKKGHEWDEGRGELGEGQTVHTVVP